MHGLSEQGKQKRKKQKQAKTLQTSPFQAVQQEGQHPSTQSLEYQVPMPGLDVTGISPEHLPSRLNILLLLLYLLSFCIITFSITIFLFLFLPSSFSLFFLHYNPLFSS
jgi:hypothetical protein